MTVLENDARRADVVFTIGRSGVWRSDDFGMTWKGIPINKEDWGAWADGHVHISRANPDVVWAGYVMDKTPPLTGRLPLQYGWGPYV